MTKESKAVRDLRARIGAEIRASIKDVNQLDEERAYLATPAPNAIEYFLRDDYGAAPEITNHFGQYQTIRDFFELLCPVCAEPEHYDCHITVEEGHHVTKSRMALEDQPLLVWSKDEDDDVCPKCRNTRFQLIDDGLLDGINQLHAVIGQRAAKSATLGCIGEYVDHRVNTLHLGTEGGIYAYLHVLKKAPLEIVFLASNQVQSQDTIYAFYRARRELAPYFQRLVPWLKKEEKEQKTPLGMQRWEYAEKDLEIEYGHMKLKVKAINSNSAGSRGHTRLFGAIDELAHFGGQDSRFSAKESYRVMETSLKTARKLADQHRLLVFIGSICSITSPSDPEDYSMELLEIGKKVRRMKTLHFATYDFTPFLTKKDFEEDRLKDPVKVKRDIDAMPETSVAPLFHDRERFREVAIGWDLESKVEFERYEFEAETTTASGKRRYRFVTLRIKHCAFVPSYSQPMFVACLDAGVTFDAFAFALAHGETDINGRLVTIFDAIGRALARPQVEVYFEGMYDVVKTIHQKMALLAVRYDHWESKQSIQNLRQEGIDADPERLTNLDKITFMTDAYQGRVQLLPPADGEEPWAHGFDPEGKSDAAVLLYELMRLDRDPQTGEVYNPKKGKIRGANSDDLACVAMHVHKVVQSLGFTTKQYDRSFEAKRKRAKETATRWSAEGGGRVIHPAGSAAPRTSLPTPRRNAHGNSGAMHPFRPLQNGPSLGNFSTSTGAVLDNFFGRGGRGGSGSGGRGRGGGGSRGW